MLVLWLQLVWKKIDIHRLLLVVLVVVWFYFIPRACWVYLISLAKVKKTQSPVLGEVTLEKPPVDSGLVSSLAGLFRPWQRSCKARLRIGR